ncbi:MAG: hypothetical protein LBC59_08990 [Chitinispirillales bacterium]|nr:hypothetical protein [Chitinispirillales bacterium]
MFPIDEDMPTGDVMAEYSTTGHYIITAPTNLVNWLSKIDGVVRRDVTDGVPGLEMFSCTQAALEVLGKDLVVYVAELPPEALEIMRKTWEEMKDRVGNEDFSRTWFK